MDGIAVGLYPCRKDDDFKVTQVGFIRLGKIHRYGKGIVAGNIPNRLQTGIVLQDIGHVLDGVPDRQCCSIRCHGGKWRAGFEIIRKFERNTAILR